MAKSNCTTKRVQNRVRLFCVLICLFALPSTAEAARLLFDVPETTIGVGQQMEMTVVVDAEGEDINALGGSIVVPSFLRIDAVRDGNSLIALWAERPEIDENTVSFAGIIPGGWNGSVGTVLSLIVTAESAGSGIVREADLQVLRHDGEGTAVSLTTSPLTIAAREGIPILDSLAVSEDTEPPAPFTPVIATDPAVFNGAAFLVFIAQDDGSGIDRYEIFESKHELRDPLRGEWEQAMSPYQLADQTRQSYIYVRAIDRAGHVRVAVVPPAEAPSRVPLLPLLITVLLVVVVVVVHRKYKRRQ